MMKSVALWIGQSLFLLLLLGLTGCSSSEFRLKNLAKTDVDLVTDLHLQQADQHLKELTIKLYKRNPRELKKAGGATIESRLQQLFDAVRPDQTGELEGAVDAEALLLTFEPDFSGDRVFALMSGLVGMLHTAYGNKEEFFMLSELDGQSLYNSARNIEILVWRLKHRLNEKGEPFLLTNSRSDEVNNLSYERLFGKLIAIQDMIARIAADKSKRRINFVVHNVASAAFLPVGL